jgi:hypothetical protein
MNFHSLQVIDKNMWNLNPVENELRGWNARERDHNQPHGVDAVTKVLSIRGDHFHDDLPCL